MVAAAVSCNNTRHSSFFFDRKLDMNNSSSLRTYKWRLLPSYVCCVSLTEASTEKIRLELQIQYLDSIGRALRKSAPRASSLWWVRKLHTFYRKIIDFYHVRLTLLLQLLSIILLASVGLVFSLFLSIQLPYILLVVTVDGRHVGEVEVIQPKWTTRLIFPSSTTSIYSENQSMQPLSSSPLLCEFEYGVLSIKAPFFNVEGIQGRAIAMFSLFALCSQVRNLFACSLFKSETTVRLTDSDESICTVLRNSMESMTVHEHANELPASLYLLLKEYRASQLKKQPGSLDFLKLLSDCLELYIGNIQLFSTGDQLVATSSKIKVSGLGFDKNGFGIEDDPSDAVVVKLSAASITLFSDSVRHFPTYIKPGGADDSNVILHVDSVAQQVSWKPLSSKILSHSGGKGGKGIRSPTTDHHHVRISGSIAKVFLFDISSTLLACQRLFDIFALFSLFVNPDLNNAKATKSIRPPFSDSSAHLDRHQETKFVFFQQVAVFDANANSFFSATAA